MPETNAGPSDLECRMDEREVIVMDNGSGYLKIGFSGEDAPRAVMPNVIATSRPEVNQEDDQIKRVNIVYGDDVWTAPNAEINAPVVRGVIQDRDEMEKIWDHAFKNVLRVEQDSMPVLIADTPMNPLISREWICEVMFEKFKVRSLALFNSSVLSLFSTGRTRGLVVDCGEGITNAVPVFEGYAIPHATFSMNVAGGDITSSLQHMMGDEHPSFASKAVMQAMKEKVCQVGRPGELSMPDTDSAEDRSFELPDGSIIEVPKNARYGVTEQLFAGDTTMQGICAKALGTCDSDFRKDLLKVVVSGGTSMLPGLSNRLRAELSPLLSNDMAHKLDITADSQRKYAAWIGGSMFASLSTFHQVVITKQDFEDGKADTRSLVAQKCF